MGTSVTPVLSRKLLYLPQLWPRKTPELKWECSGNHLSRDVVPRRYGKMPPLSAVRGKSWTWFKIVPLLPGEKKWMKILQVHLSSINFCQTLSGYSSTCSKNLLCKRAEAPIRHPEQHPQAGEECPEWEHLFLAAALGLIAHQSPSPRLQSCLWLSLSSTCKAEMCQQCYSFACLIPDGIYAGT